MTHLQETIDLLVNEVLGKFNLNYFKQLSANSVRPTSKEDQIALAYSGKSHPEIEYAKSMLPELGKGSARRTFALSGGKALKIAMNDKGIAQNQGEVQVYQNNPGNSVTTRVFDFSPDYKWVIAEIVKPMNASEFEMTTKIPNIVFIQMVNLLWKGGPDLVKKWILGLKRMIQDGEMFTQNTIGQPVKTRDYLAAALTVTKNPEAFGLLQNVVNFAKKNSLHKDEIVPAHFGRTVDGRVIFYDYGATEEVIRVHYK